MKIQNNCQSPVVIAFNRYNIMQYPVGTVEVSSMNATFHLNYLCHHFRARNAGCLKVILTEAEYSSLGCASGDGSNCVCRQKGFVQKEESLASEFRMTSRQIQEEKETQEEENTSLSEAEEEKGSEENKTTQNGGRTRRGKRSS